NGYGKPNLYTCDLKYSMDGRVSDSRRITFGIRQYSYDTIGHVLHISVNGKRIFIKGGNWGMSEYMLRCRGDEYDLKVKLHKEMHLNMIRNWIGSTTDDAFYDACDKYGIMVWDDFWLNSHPNLPIDIFDFNRNAVEKIKRFRNHPCIAIWCGENEGVPLPPLNGWLAEDVKTFDGGDRWYQPNSHAGNLTGSGPWTNFDPQWYFTRYPGGFGGNKGWGLRTEIGTAVFPTFASFKKFIPEKDWWPRNEMWNKHFFGKSAANAGPDHYMESIDERYGKPTGIKDFCRKAQLLNIETNKALFEGWQQHIWNDAFGVMLWMSNPAYPSMVWQTYDYYYDLTGAYWGVRKSCEPLHIQWSYADNSVKVINTTDNDYDHLEAQAIVYDLSGKKTNLEKTVEINSKSNTAQPCFNLDLGFNTNDLAYGKKTVASSVSKDAGGADAVTDGNQGTRWSSDYSDDQWIYIDLGKEEKFSTVVLNWEAAYAKTFKLQISDDASGWRDIYTQKNGKGGVESVTFHPVKARYVRMLGLQRATFFGYSLYEFEILKNQRIVKPQVQFIRLLLKDKMGNLLSDNFYWRSAMNNDYTALNTLPPVKLKVTSFLTRENDSDIIEATIINPASSKAVAFAVYVQAVRSSDGTRILPAFMNDNYFTLMKGESKKIRIIFDPKLLKDGKYQLLVTPYNNK
ncbi:MAG: beta-mannosidase, partial [Chitinophagaceae bacterium]